MALKCAIDDKGIMSGEGSINSSSYARKHRMQKYAVDPEGFKQYYFVKPNPSLQITDVVVKNADTDSLPLAQQVRFTTPVSSSGEYSYFTTNMLSDFMSNPFMNQDRRTDIDFGFQKSYVIYGQFTIPEGYNFETLPANVNMSMPDRSIQYSRTMEFKNNVLSQKITIDFKRPFYLAANYPVFHEFHKKLLVSLNEQVVIKKKS